jgi:hypothetical protein
LLINGRICVHQQDQSMRKSSCRVSKLLSHPQQFLKVSYLNTTPQNEAITESCIMHGKGGLKRKS